MVDLTSQELLQKAFVLFSDKPCPKMSLRYSSKFKSYNATVSIQKTNKFISSLSFSLSRDFYTCEDDIVLGLLHHLLNRVYKESRKSIEQDLYDGFSKRVSRYAKRIESHSLLTDLFHELNEEYFNGLLEKPNLVFGRESTTTLGNYNFSTDTVTLSTALKQERDLLRYVLYHELLHKKHSFKRTISGRTNYHTTSFRKDELAYNDKFISNRLEQFIRMKKRTIPKSSTPSQFTLKKFISDFWK
jgi:hypothetical protein